MKTPDPTFWAGKRVFLTGHTGFKGSWLVLLLTRLGANVTGFSLPAPVSEPALFEAAGLSRLCQDLRGDVRDCDAVGSAVAAAQADVLIHMAAQPLVRLSVLQPVATFEVNLMGTVNVLEAARSSSSIKAVVIVTTDKCYENVEQIRPYAEADRMGGSDPYSASKGCAELATTAYARTFGASSGVRIVSVRAGNVIGGGDWALDRLVPDLVRAAGSGETVDIRSPDAVRPWQHVLDPLVGYLLAAERACHGHAALPHDAWNFGPATGEEFTVREVVEVFQSIWGDGVSVRFAETSVEHARAHREAGVLRVDNTKAKVELGWRSLLANRAAVEAAATWYRDYLAGADALTLLERDVDTLLPSLSMSDARQS